MHILSLHIREFGGLRDLSVELSQSFNLITGDNESGKSTLIAFIRFMFYGLPKRTAGEVLSDSDRAFSWENGVADGSLTLLYGEKTYRIERREKEGSTRKLLQIIDEATGEPLPKGETPESRFLSFPMSVFDSTCCIRQLRSSEIHGDGLSNAIENLLLSGDESVSTDRAADLLEKARKTLLHKNGKGGELYRQKLEITELNQTLSRIREDETALQEAKKERSRLESLIRVASMEAEKAELESGLCADAQILDRFDALRSENERVNVQAEVVASVKARCMKNGVMPNKDLIRSLEDAAEMLAEHEQNRLTAESALAEAGADRSIDRGLLNTADAIRAFGGSDKALAEIRRLMTRKKSRRRVAALLPSIGLIAALICFSIAFLHQSLIPAAVGGAVAILLTAVGLFLLKNSSAAKKSLSDLLLHFGITDAGNDPARACSEVARNAFREAERAREAEIRLKNAEHAAASASSALLTCQTRIQAQFPTILPADASITSALLRRTASDLNTALHTVLRAEENLAILKEHRDRSAAALSAYDEATIRASLPKGFDKARGVEFYRERSAAARSRLQTLEQERLDIERRTSALEAIHASPESVEAEIAEKTAAYHALTEKFRAIQLAQSALEEARAGLKARISPRLRRDAARYLEEISQGRYTALSLDGDFSLSAEDQGRLHISDAFSGGTRDAMYLSLRLALSDMLSPAGAPLPVILDEALSQLDDTRAAALLRILLHRAENGGQVLLFSCHTREKEMLKDQPAKVISLSD